MSNYQDFIKRKSQLTGQFGFDPVWMPDFLFDFQRNLVDWAVRKGRAAIFADCGLGKTPMQLTWAENVARKEGKPVLIVTPLAVAAQTKREAEKFGIEANVSRDGTVYRITITNYEGLHKLNADDFVGAVADESSAIKAFNGKRRKQVVRFFSKMPYRLLCTATPSPNDFIELGTQSECLGIMTQSDMLGFFFRETENMRHTVFREDDFWNKLKYWFKPHSEKPFWKWVCSWARALRSPADLGFDDADFRLPPLNYEKHVTDVPFIPKGELFPRPAKWLHEQREERHRSLHERCEKVAEIAAGCEGAFVAWCHYNEEGDLLEKIIPGSVQISGSNSDDWKEAAVEWFCGIICRCQLKSVGKARTHLDCMLTTATKQGESEDSSVTTAIMELASSKTIHAFCNGQCPICGSTVEKHRVLITKPKIGCWGLNLQFCGDMTIFPSFSFEQFYQAVRRCWRFGRKGPVNVHVVSALGEAEVIDGLKRKQEQAETMFKSLIGYMHESMEMNSKDGHTNQFILPPWMETSDAGTRPTDRPDVRPISCGLHGSPAGIAG